MWVIMHAYCHTHCVVTSYRVVHDWCWCTTRGRLCALAQHTHGCGQFGNNVGLPRLFVPAAHLGGKWNRNNVAVLEFKPIRLFQFHIHGCRVGGFTPYQRGVVAVYNTHFASRTQHVVSAIEEPLHHASVTVRCGFEPVFSFDNLQGTLLRPRSHVLGATCTPTVWRCLFCHWKPGRVEDDKVLLGQVRRNQVADVSRPPRVEPQGCGGVLYRSHGGWVNVHRCDSEGWCTVFEQHECNDPTAGSDIHSTLYTRQAPALQPRRQRVKVGTDPLGGWDGKVAPRARVNGHIQLRVLDALAMPSGGIL
eukprot:m.180924 g.180924  ORF g.180924 m.180924 type:complete len:306 (+) comp15138_c0_seq1:161-1078(+)